MISARQYCVCHEESWSTWQPNRSCYCGEMHRFKNPIVYLFWEMLSQSHYFLCGIIYIVQPVQVATSVKQAPCQSDHVRLHRLFSPYLVSLAEWPPVQRDQRPPFRVPSELKPCNTTGLTIRTSPVSVINGLAQQDELLFLTVPHTYCTRMYNTYVELYKYCIYINGTHMHALSCYWDHLPHETTVVLTLGGCRFHCMW